MSDNQKQCTGPCGKVYPATTEYWHKNRQTKDGFARQCKHCIKEKAKEYYSRSEVKAHVKEYNSRPEVKKRHTERQKSYRSRPEVQAQRSAYASRPDIRQRLIPREREYRNRPEVRERGRVYRKRLEVQARRQAYFQRPEVQEHERAHRQAYAREYLKRPEVRERRKNYSKTYGHKRRARGKSIKGVHTPAQIEAQLKRQRHKCYYCHSRIRKVKGKYIYHIEHTFPLSRVAGTDIPANNIDYIVLACPTCNLSKGNKFPWEWSEGGRLC